MDLNRRPQRKQRSPASPGYAGTGRLRCKKQRMFAVMGELGSEAVLVRRQSSITSATTGAVRAIVQILALPII